MKYILSTQEIREKFGDIDLEVISQKENIRTSCVKKSSDGAVLAYSMVTFQNEGINAFGAFHQDILGGEPLGETIKNSGIIHKRTVSEQYFVEINFGLSFIFNTKKTVCLSRKIEYTIKGVLYASIDEFYSPDFFPVEKGIKKSSLAHQDDWFTIASLSAGYEEKYLRLAHGFLKKPMHIGIENQDIFVAETLKTLDALMQDVNTNLFVAADKYAFIGYVALNIHPALHINGYECLVRELYVVESKQRKRVGAVLMEYVERYVKKRGCKRISLATKWDDEKQRGFYESLGFSRRCDFVVKKVS